MSWTAIVPLKPEGARKSRLAEALSAAERKTLARRLFAHVSAALEAHPQIEKTHVLAAARPEGWAGAWIADRGRGLNAELEAARAALGARRLAGPSHMAETQPRSSPRKRGSTEALEMDPRFRGDERKKIGPHASSRRLLVVLGDLPLLQRTDLDALLEGAARAGAAIAPDRHGTGANALALCAGAPVAFCFGPDSFRRYRAQAPGAAIVRTEGLGLDIDTPDDLAFAKARGFRL